MTRPVPPGARVQRAESAREIRTGQRDKGYEPRDASPRLVLITMACFLGLMLLGLAFSAATLGWLGAREDEPGPPSAMPQVQPPSPGLLVEPVAARIRHDQAVRRGLDPAALARAERAMVSRGWGESQPAASPAEVARDHVENVR